jgi:MinD-like ATPase involved in chromosome partitioning or flagellar assembly
VHSFRGGTGKSNTTANLAATMAATGRRVGVVDTDIQSPGIHTLFGLDADSMASTLNDYLWGHASIEDVACDVTSQVAADGGSPLPGAIYLVPSSLRAGDITRILREGYDVSRLNDGFREMITWLALDILLIDTHPGLNEETLLSITISDTLVIILRPDQQDYQGTAVAVEVARKLEVPRLVLVVNKVLPELDVDDVRREVEATYRAPVAALLPLSEDLVRLGSRGIFSRRQPGHPWSRGVQALGEQILA